MVAAAAALVVGMVEAAAMLAALPVMVSQLTVGTAVIYWGGGPWGWYGDNYWDDYPYYGYDDYNDGDYEQTVVAVQQELEKLGYYHGQIDGIVGPETRKAISWFQSVDKLSVSGRIDDATLKALQIS